MQKEDVVELRKQAEANCRIYFDQLNTLKQQAEQVATSLEQERGKVAAFMELEGKWGTSPVQPADFTPPEPISEAPGKKSAIPVPAPSISNSKKEK